jgi:hypothetical protein
MMNDTRFDQELRAGLRAESERLINVDRAWNRFQRRRQASRRRRQLTAAAVAVAVVAVLVPVAVVRLSGAVASRSGQPAARPVPTTLAGEAVVARIPVADVVSLASYGSDVWALTDTHELVRIDARTNAVTLRVPVAGLAHDTTVVTGGGALWLDGVGSSGHSRLLRIDPATGAISARTNLPAGCGQAAYGLGHVWVLCNGTDTTKVLRIDPATALVDAQTGALPGPAYSLVAGSEGVWYVAYVAADAGPAEVDPSGTHLTGLKVTGPKYLNVHSPDYIGPLAAAQLVLGDGAVWALGGNVSGRPESIAAINPATGRITRAFTYSEAAGVTYDFWGLYGTVGQGSIWLLAPLGHNEIVRVSMTTGRPLSVVFPGGWCSQGCSQIYDAAGAVWEPTSQQILRIDPARMPG